MNYSSELYYSLIDHDYYFVLIYCILGFFVILAPLFFYMLLRILPKNITAYKYILSSCLVSNSTLVFLRAIWIPIPTTPIMGVYSAGIISNLGPTANLVCLNIYFILLIKMQLCICYCVIFQFSALQPFSWVAHLGKCPKRVVTCYVYYFLSMATILTILLQLSVVDRNEFMKHAILTNNLYAIELIKNQPTWIGFSATLKPCVIIFGIFASLPDISVALFSIFLTTKIYFVIEANKATVSQVTYNLEKNLFHTFLFRTFTLVVFYTIPYLSVVLSIFFEIHNPNLGIIFHSIIIVESFICLAVTILFVKYFRVWIFGCFKAKIGDITNKQSNTSDLVQTPSTLSISVKDLPPLQIKH